MPSPEEHSKPNTESANGHAVAGVRHVLGTGADARRSGREVSTHTLAPQHHHDAAPQYVGPVACSPSAIAAAQLRQQKIMPSCSTRVEASTIVVAQWAQVPAAPSR
jgi:hypothetical protein